MTPVEIFDAIAPKLAANSAKLVYLQLAEDRTSPCFFGANRSQAVALRAAHTMSLFLDPLRAGGTGGAITQKAEGDLSISFGAAQGSTVDNDLSQTSYGRQLDGLIRGSGAFVGVSGNVLRGSCG